MKKSSLKRTVSLLTWVATASMAAASGMLSHQPKVPKALRK